MKKSHGLLIAAVALVMLLATGVFAACGSNDTASASSSKSDVIAAAQGDDQLSQFAQAMQGAGLDGTGPYTVFAPTNDAVSQSEVTLDADQVKASTIEGAQLTKDEMAKGTKNDAMLADNSITTYTGSDGSLYVRGFKVVGGPITSGNGVIYKIDGVIAPK